MSWKRLGYLWHIMGSTIIVLVLINIFLNAIFSLYYSRSRGPGPNWDGFSESRRQAYRGMTSDEVRDLLDWTWRPGFVYEPEIGFHEASRASRFVNVSTQGIRLTPGAESELAKADLDKSILLFGGSTMFGYGVSDAQTIAAHLQRGVQRFNFMNLGRGAYYSGQESLFLLRLLQSGYRIRYAAFLDGINERCDFGLYRAQLEKLFNQAQSNRVGYFWDWRHQFLFPMEWLARLLRAKIAPPPIKPDYMDRLNCHNYDNTVRLRDVVAQNMKARRGICAAFGVLCITFIQPFGGVHGPLVEQNAVRPGMRAAFKAKYEQLRPMWNETGAVDISEVLDSISEPAFVDNVHYSNGANKLIAERMWPVLRERFGLSE